MRVNKTVKIDVSISLGEVEDWVDAQLRTCGLERKGALILNALGLSYQRIQPFILMQAVGIDVDGNNGEEDGSETDG